MASNPKVFAFDEVEKHDDRKDCWVIIHGKVYDVSPFMNDHPGGDEVLLTATGKDATDDFEQVGHSNSARELMEKYCIGNIDSSTNLVRRKYRPPPRITDGRARRIQGVVILILKFLLPLLMLGLAFGLPLFGKKD
ncbi:cytochrome b5-like [Malania oleifera]|uniref:cytochrome b5-like n=1 Tax=Malania oleifera TaxID=397392 RepID=UPI0025AE290B|nr:cytochrome b5-like [Malania oleifera]